jgi:hypothetical protein
LNKAESRNQEIEESKTDDEQFNEKTWRREKVWELKSKGYTHREIIEEISRKDPLVKISLGTVNNDLTRKQTEIRANFQKYIEQDLVAHHHLALTNLQAINKEAWRIFEKAEDEKVKLSALHTAQEAQSAINATLGDPEYIAKAMKVAGKLRQQLHDRNVENEVEDKGSSSGNPQNSVNEVASGE